MYLWQAAVCVLYGDEPNSYRHIAHEILRRGLSASYSRQLSQTIGTILREHGHGHFYALGEGYYRLGDRDSSRAVYVRMTELYPHFFPKNDETPQSTEQSDDGTAAHQTTRKSIAPGRSDREQKGETVGRLTPQRDISELTTQIIAEQVPTTFEGKKKQIYIDAFERDQNARKLCIQLHGFSCSVCRMRFEDEFGDVGKGFIHVHHLLPFSREGARETNPVDDLRPVCPNCHAMLHRGESTIGRPYSIDELRDFRRSAKRRMADRRRQKKRKCTN